MKLIRTFILNVKPDCNANSTTSNIYINHLILQQKNQHQDMISHCVIHIHRNLLTFSITTTIVILLTE